MKSLNKFSAACTSHIMYAAQMDQKILDPSPEQKPLDFNTIEQEPAAKAWGDKQYTKWIKNITKKNKII